MDVGIVQDFSKLRVLPPQSNKGASSKNRRSLVVDIGKEEHSREEGRNRMDALVQDLNSALEESTTSVIGTATKESGNTGKQLGKRRVWRRRCKSTSNLAAMAQNPRVGNKLPSTINNNAGIATNISATAESSNAMTTTQNNSDETGRKLPFVRELLGINIFHCIKPFYFCS